MNISELFFSLQGEGKRTGFPSFFIRTNYCNLRCKFPGGNFCDTYYTSWNPEDKSNIGKMEIGDIIKKYYEYYPNDIVITGGEPALQKEKLTNLCKEIKKLYPKVFITLETNGTIAGDFINFINLASISPKLASSVPRSTKFEDMHNINRINIEALKDYYAAFNKSVLDIQWKFVTSSEEDISDIFQLKEIIGFDNKDIFLMPEGITAKDIENKSKLVSSLCVKYRLNFSGRLHIQLWGNRRST